MTSRFAMFILALVFVTSCGATRPPPAAIDNTLSPTSTADALPAIENEEQTSPGTGIAVTIQADVWADNWFALYLDDALIKEDSVSITTERSFNSEVFTFDATYPLHINVVIKDYIQDDTGLEYIGTARQQIGDGGFIAQFSDAETGMRIAVTNSEWRCTAIHIAPLNPACAAEANPVPGQGACTNTILPEPPNWKNTTYDDTAWPDATVSDAQAVGPKEGYDGISWDPVHNSSGGQTSRPITRSCAG